MVAPKLHATLSRGLQVEFASVGRNKATTFTGLCAHHDDAIFAPIEKSPLDLSDPQHLFLLAYRAATRELHATMEAAIRVQAGYQERVDRGLDRANEMTPAGLEATARVVIAHDTFRYRCRLDDSLRTGDFSFLEHDVLIANVGRPTIAASSLFSLDEAQVHGEVVLVHLNVLPTSPNQTAVVWSYTRENAAMARAYLDRALNASGYQQLYEISRVILARCENFVLSPDYYDTWTSQKKRTVHDYFLATLLRRDLELESVDLYLF